MTVSMTWMDQFNSLSVAVRSVPWYLKILLAPEKVEAILSHLGLRSNMRDQTAGLPIHVAGDH